MGIGREVADAYIDVHGDLSKFRDDLDQAGGALAEKKAIAAADNFSVAWAARIQQDVNGKWASIVDAMYSDNAIDWERLLGQFDSTTLDEAQSKILAFLDDMREGGKLTQDEFDGANKALKGQIANLKDAAKATDRLDQETRGLGMALDANRKFMAEMDAENQKWARTYEGMFKNNQLADIEADFKAMARAMNDLDWSKFTKGFESLDEASRRMKEINVLMREQGRITDENAERMAASLDAYIQGERDKTKAMRDALDETNRLKKAQDAYNQSLSGMARNNHFAELEAQFRRLAIAMDSNDWSHFAKGADNAKDMQFRISQVAAEMHRLGRMTDEELRLVNARAKEASGNFRDLSGETERVRRAMDNATSSSGGFRRALGGMSAAMGRLGALTKGFREHLGGFAGLNVFEDMVRSGLDFVHNLDRIALGVSKNTLLMGTLAATGVSALGGLVTIAADLGDVIGGLGVLAPAFLVGTGIGIAVMQAAFKDMDTVLKDLTPAFEQLQDSISAAFWKQAAQPIRDMVNKLLPTLKKQLDNTATATGGVFAKLADAVGNIPAEDITVMFERMNRAIDILGGAMAPLIRAFNNLGKAGSKQFERLATWLVDLSNKFDAFIQKAADNGDLDRWIENAIEGMKNIGRSIDGAIGIFNALNTAARRAGFDGLKAFADGLQRAAAIMQSPEFQNTLTVYFEAALVLTDKLSAAIAGLGPAIQSFTPTAVVALGQIGDAVSTLIGYIGQIFSNPTFQKGVQDFTVGLNDAVRKLEPAIKPFADSLGQALSLLGQIVVSVAEVATAMATNWFPVLDSMSTKLETLITPLKEGVIKAIEDLKPILEGIDKNIVGPLVTALTEEGGLLDVLTGPGGLTEKISEVGTALTEDFGDIIKPLVGEGGVLPGLVKVAGELLGPLGDLFSLFTPTLVSLLEKTGTALNNLANDLKVIKGELPIEDLSFFKSKTEEEIRAELEAQLQPKTWGQIIAELLTGSIHVAIQQAGSKIWNEAIVPFFGWLGGEIAKAWTSFWSEDSPLSDENIAAAWNKAWGDFFTNKGPLQKLQEEFAAWAKTADWGKVAKDVLVGFVSSLTLIGPETWNGLIDAFSTWISTVDWGKLGDDLWNGFIAGVTGKTPKEWGEITDGFKGWVEDILAFFGIHSPSTLMFGIAGDVVAGFVNGFVGLKDLVVAKWNEMWAGLDARMVEWREGVNKWAEEVKTNWDTFWGNFGQIVATKWEEIKTTLATKWEEITTNINVWIEARKTDWTNFWGSFGETISTKWEEFKTTLATKWEEIKTSLNTWIEERKTDWSNFWGSFGTTVSTKWEEFKTTINTKIEEIKTALNTWIEDRKTDWRNFWTEVANFLPTKWEEMKTTIRNKFEEIKGALRTKYEEAKRGWEGFWNEVSNFLPRKWEEIRRGVETGIQNVVNFFTGLPGRIQAALGSLNLWQNGWNILQGLWNGMITKWNEMTSWIGGLANWIAENKGPLDYDRKLLEPAGKAIMVGLENGLKSRMDPLLNTLQAITEAVTDTVTADLSKSVMYVTGKDAAQGLADGLKANRSSVHTALGNLGAFTMPSSNITVGGSFGSVGRPTIDAAPGRSLTIAEGAIKIETPTKSPELVAAKVIDSFVNYSTF